jgi:hypothetical protein
MNDSLFLLFVFDAMLFSQSTKKSITAWFCCKRSSLGSVIARLSLQFLIKTLAILGFEELCKLRFKKTNASVIPSRLYSDVVENVFCQQRTLHNGANTNPTYLNYCYAMNSVILGQATVSRKSNTGGETAEPQTNKHPGKVINYKTLYRNHMSQF